MNVTLLADPEKKVVKRFSGTNLLGWANRKSFLIDPFGKLRKIYDTVDTKTHAQEVLRDLEGLTELVDNLGKLESSNSQILASISAASRIQKAILPDFKIVKSHFKDFSLLWEPRDIVGGDCYWTAKINNYIWIGLFDCTGHGIPGAFLTLILMSKLVRIFQNIQEVSEHLPSLILEEIDENLRDSLGHEEHGYSGREGADGCILRWEIGSSSIIYSSANMPIITQMRDKTNVHFGIRRSLGYGKNSTRKFEDNTLDPAESIAKGGTLRPLMQPLVAPGILYNSIKSGMAVDYPIVTDPTKISKRYYGPQVGTGTPSGRNAVYTLTDNWALTTTNGLGSNNVSAQYGKLATGYYGDVYWDQRLPFEPLNANHQNTRQI